MRRTTIACRLLLLFLFYMYAGNLYIQSFAAETEMIVPGGDWRDTDGKLISATEGGIIKVGDLYYLWGMDRSANNYTFVGVNLYSSSDLKNWKFVNQILKKSSHQDLDNGAVVERAKILHNPKTGKFIMWMHYEGYNAYSTAEVGYAICDSISGNFTFKSHFRPLNIDSRDINVYQDDDGKGYLICTTKGNQNVSLFELDENYTGIVREVYRGSASDDMECEGHAIIKTGGYYFWLMSWCTGWDFNDNHYFYSKTLAGPWTAGGNIAVSNTHTYDSQVGYAVTVKGSTATTYLYTGDRWCVNNYGMSRIVLLPIEVAGTKLKVNWNDQWNINVSTGEWAPGAKSFIDGVYTITAKHSGMVFGTSGASVQQQTYTGAETQLWRIQNIGASHFKISSVASGRVMDISGGSREAGAKLLQYDWNDGYNQKWQIIDCGNGYHRLVNVNTLGKSLEVANSSNLAGTDVVLGSFGYKDNQLLRLTAVKKDVESKKTYMILNRGSGKALDAGSQTADAAITQQSATGTASQVWKVVDLFNGYYTISTNANIALDNSESVRNLDAITCNILDGSYSQQWQIVPVETGYYKLINRLSGKAVDNKDGLSDDGNPVIQYTDYASNNTNQQWKFVPAEFVGSKYRSPQCQSSVNGPNDKKYFFDLRGRAISLKYSSVNKKVTEAPGFHGVCIVRQRDKLQRMVIVE